jgi:DNA-directed RNA polymerase subunit H
MTSKDTTETNSYNSLISNIHKSRMNLLELMKLQGYNVEDYENFSINEVNSMSQSSQLDMLLEKKEKDPKINRKKKIYIRYYLEKPIQRQNIQEIIDDLFYLEEVLTKDDILYIVSKSDMNDTQRAAVKHIWEQDGIFVVIQNIQRLQFNILNHKDVPPHRIISNEEKEKIMLKWNIKNDSEFPEISRFDPVSQVICIRPGQVCEIKRPSKTAIESLYYRVCI